jgi:hypothetical protein
MESDFIDELLREAEEKEQKLSREFADLMLIEISQLEKQIQSNFEQAAREREIIKNWSLKINSKLVSRIEFLSKKLEVFIKETGEKTINLPNGILKMHKKPDKVEVEDLELFLKNARPEWLTVIPEQVKPNLLAIKNHIKTRPIPKGVKIIEGQIEFSYSLNNEEENAREETETGTGIKQAV